jgi:hypothetical protein
MKKQLISVGELIDQSWEVYRHRFTEIISISGWLLISAILFAVSLAFYPTASSLQLNAGLSSGEIFGVVLFSLTTLLLSPILSFWIYTSITRAIGTHVANKKPNPKTAMKEGWSVFFPSLLTTIMVVLMILLAIVIGMAPPVIIASIGALTNVSALILIGNTLIIVGLLIAVFLSIKWTVYYMLAPIITMLEKKPGKVALATSRQLIEGKFWDVLIRISVPKLVFIIFGVFLMSAISYLINIFIDASGGLNADLQLRIVTMTQAIVPIIIAVIINPLIVISDVLLLKSLKSNA